jgi:hypothetical protein
MPHMPGIPPELKPVFERFTEGPSLVTRATEGIDPATLSRAGVEGWSVRDVLVHLSDSELVRAVRMRMILAEDEPTLFVYDEGVWKKRLHYLWRSPEAAISLFQQTRFGTAELLRQCDRQSWARTAIHPELGRLALADMLRIGVEHVDTHVAQIAALRQRS